MKLTRMVCMQTRSKPLKWALAGRDSAKLEEVKNSLIAINRDCKVRPSQLNNQGQQSYRGAALERKRLCITGLASGLAAGRTQGDHLFRICFLEGVRGVHKLRAA